MPAGDPAGYLPSVIKKRIKAAGAKPYKPRSKRGRPKKLKPAVGVKSPVKPGNLVPLPRVKGSVTPMPKREGDGSKLPPHLRGKRLFNPKNRRSGY